MVQVPFVVAFFVEGLDQMMQAHAWNSSQVDKIQDSRTTVHHLTYHGPHFKSRQSSMSKSQCITLDRKCPHQKSFYEILWDVSHRYRTIQTLSSKKVSSTKCKSPYMPNMHIHLYIACTLTGLTIIEVANVWYASLTAQSQASHNIHKQNQENMVNILLL